MGSQPLAASELWHTSRTPSGVRDKLLLSKRRRRFCAFPGIEDQALSDETGSLLFKQFAPELAGCTTGEMASRPIVHAFGELTPQMRNLKALFTEHARWCVGWFIERARLKAQTYDARGGIGAPIYKRTPNKLEELRPIFADCAREDYSHLDNGRTLCNVRCQPEASTKERIFQFIDKEGVPYEKKVTKFERMSPDGWLYPRSRAVVMPGASNNYLQMADSHIHTTQLMGGYLPDAKYLMHHFGNLAGVKLAYKYKFAADVKHCERAIGMLVRPFAQAVGGGYLSCYDALAALAWAFPTDDWSGVFDARPRAGVTLQLGSGFSCVTTLAKLVFEIIIAQAISEIERLTFREAWLVMMLGWERVRIMNYGDDNFFATDDKGALDRLLAVIDRYIHIEEEDPPAFLGHNYDEQRGFVLRARSYLANFWIAEREPGSLFRPYPHYGFVMRRELYSRDGEAIIRKEIIPTEDRLLKKIGIEMSEVYRKARQEQAAIGALPWARAVDKDYQLTEEEKSQLPEYQILPAAEVAEYLRVLFREHNFHAE